MTGARAAGLATILWLLAGCSDVVVMPADVAAVRIVPDEAQVSVGASVQLVAELEDLEGRTVRGQGVAWSSDHPEIATVHDDGRVVGERSGTATVRARAGGVEGTAVVRVQTPASILVTPTTASFSMESGGSTPADRDVAITNGGEAPLTGLTTSISYGSGASGWLSATPSGTSAPSTLTLKVVAASVPPPGEYQASVRVSSPSAADPATIIVSLEVRVPPQRQRPPAAPTNLRVENVNRNRVLLAWTNNSGTAPVFEVERASPNGTFSLLATTAEDATSHDDRTVSANTTYRYRVRACNEGGCSSYSDAITVVVPG